MVSITSKTPLISVIIPAYNHEKFIGPAIDSVLSQSVGDFELIVIDDGSTDKTAKVIQGYTDPRLTYYHQQNKDAYNTINRGLGLAKGKYIAILNSDDVYAAGRFERLVVFSEETNAACVFTDVVPISDSGEVFSDPAFGWNVWHQKNRNFYYSFHDLYTAFLKGNFMVTTSNLFMTSHAAKLVGNFCSLRYLHDYDFMFRMLLACPQDVHYLAEDKLLFYRIHSGNTLGEAAIKGRVQDQELITRYLAAKIPEEYRKYIQAGAERLIELGNELHEVRMLLEPERPKGVRPAAKELAKALKTWTTKLLHSTKP